jgi:uncharacterized protein with PIN domain
VLKFVIDGMLGKLARWLRMMGHNVKYSTNMDDFQLLALAKNEHRTLLTRDFELYQHAIAKGLDAFYVEGGTEEERLAELARRYGFRLEIDMSVSRCPKCNTTVQRIPKEEAMGAVEESTFRYYNEFWECPKCHKVYWQGAHWTRIRKTLEAAESQLESVERKGA